MEDNILMQMTLVMSR